MSVIDLSRALRERTRLLVQFGHCAKCRRVDWLDEEELCIYCGKCPSCGCYGCPNDACGGQPSLTLAALGERWRAVRARVEQEKRATLEKRR